jgi:hypothetical protein
MSSVRRSRSARKVSSELTVMAILVACSCRQVPDGPAPAEVSSPGTPGPTALPEATAQPMAVTTPSPKPSAPKTVTPISLAEPTEAKPAATPASVSEPQLSEGESLLLENLANAVRDTPFSAVVQHLRVDEVPLGSDEVKAVYHVRVVEHIRGPKLQELSYFAVVEKGEDTSFTKEPVILTLCKGKEGFYWPGTGAQFPRTKNTAAVVDKLRPELGSDQKVFAQCRPAP